MDSHLLQNIYLFKELDKNELAQVESIVKEKSYSPGEEIFSRGDTAEAMFVIKMGGVSIRNQSTKGDDIKIATLGSGSHFGEMPFLDNEKRSATASVMEPSSIIEIAYKDLKNLIDKNDKIAIKVYKALATYLGGRLRVTTQDLNYVKEINLRHF